MRRLQRFFGVLALGACVLAAPLAASGEPTVSGEPEEVAELLRGFLLHEPARIEPIIGRASKRAHTDKARIALVITTESARLSRAIAENARVREQFSEELRAAGVPEAAISSAKFSSSPQFGWFGSQPRAFEVAHRMTVSITRGSELRAVATVADAHEAVAIAGMEFEHTKKEELQRQVKREAIADVLKQKALYEKEFGVKLVLVDFEEGEVRAMPAFAAMRMQRADDDNEYRASAQREETPADTFDETTFSTVITGYYKIIAGS